MTPTIDISSLESHLWEAANILRGSPVDRTDWNSYILLLLFFKRICDVWDEEYQEAVETYGEDFADEHRFQIPEGNHWNNVHETPTNVGTALQNAMRGIEAANQKHLYGVFGDSQWTNKDRGKTALTALFEEVRTSETLIVVQRIVDDIDDIVRKVRFPEWQATNAGEREVRKALRRTLFKYKLHTDTELFEKAYGYVREYY